MLITTSFVSIALYNVSLLDPLRKLSTQEKITVGGCALKRMKKLKGAKFTTPLASIELTKAIGRGETAPVRFAYNSLALIDFASNVFIDHKGTETTCFLKICVRINFRSGSTKTKQKQGGIPRRLTLQRHRLLVYFLYLGSYDISHL